MSSQHPHTPCPRCQSPQSPHVERHEGGMTIICRSCGHARETDRLGNPYFPPSPDDQTLRSVDHNITAYPLLLACTTIQLLLHDSAVRAINAYLTPPNPTILTFHVYHQPFRIPILSFRNTRSRSQQSTRYIYAAEMSPYHPTLVTPHTKAYRNLQNLIQTETSHHTGHQMRTGAYNWPICHPGSILTTPLAPTE